MVSLIDYGQLVEMAPSDRDAFANFIIAVENRDQARLKEVYDAWGLAIKYKPTDVRSVGLVCLECEPLSSTPSCCGLSFRPVWAADCSMPRTIHRITRRSYFLQEVNRPDICMAMALGDFGGSPGMKECVKLLGYDSISEAMSSGMMDIEPMEVGGDPCGLRLFYSCLLTAPCGLALAD